MLQQIDILAIEKDIKNLPTQSSRFADRVVEMQSPHACLFSNAMIMKI